MEPIFGVMSMYDVARNDQGELDPDLYMERVSNLGKKYGFVPTAITLGANYFGEKAKDKGFLRELKAKLEEMQLKPFSFCGGLYLSPKSWEQEESLKRTIEGLEFCAEIGSQVAMFGPRFHGRVAREGRNESPSISAAGWPMRPKTMVSTLAWRTTSTGSAMTSRCFSPTATGITSASSTTPATG